MDDKNRIAVSPDWLLGHLDEEKTRILDTRDQNEFKVAHIPGAVQIPYGTIVKFVAGAPYLDIAPKERIEEILSKNGISRGDRAIVYGDGGGAAAARLFWTLELYGVDVRLLGINFARWKSLGLPVTRETTKCDNSRFIARDDSSPYLVSADYVLAKIASPDAVILDTRSPQEYSGHASHGPVRGRIPGSVNIPWDLCVGEDGIIFRSGDELRAVFASRGIDEKKEVICYCHSGKRASHTFLALRLIGHPRPRIYARSFLDWGSRTDLPLEEG